MSIRMPIFTGSNGSPWVWSPRVGGIDDDRLDRLLADPAAALVPAVVLPAAELGGVDAGRDRRHRPVRRAAIPWSIGAGNIRSAYRTSPSCPAPSSSIAAPFCIQYLDSPTDREARKGQDQGADARPCLDQRPPGDDRRAPRATTDGRPGQRVPRRVRDEADRPRGGHDGAPPRQRPARPRRDNRRARGHPRRQLTRGPVGLVGCGRGRGRQRADQHGLQGLLPPPSAGGLGLPRRDRGAGPRRPGRPGRQATSPAWSTSSWSARPPTCQ